VAKPELFLPPDTDIVAYLASLDPDDRRAAIEMLGAMERDALDRAWREWTHEGQREPNMLPDGSDWRIWVIMAGRGFGKTLAGAHWVKDAADRDGRLRIALVAATLDEARRVMIEGTSGLLAVADGLIANWCPSLRVLRFKSGAEAALFSGASPEILRGPQHHIAWCDELAKWEKPGETWDMLQLGLRLGHHPRALVTTTPRPGPVLKRIMANPHCITTGGPTTANPHLPRAYVDNVTEMFAGTRLGRQELDGELLSDAPGALWTVELLAKCRAQGSGWGPSASQRLEPVSVGQPATARSAGCPGDFRAPERGDRTDVTDSLRDVLTRPAFVRCVIAVDPPSGDGTCGIIACAKDAAGRGHVLADHSVTARSPEGWSRAVADAVRIWSNLSAPAFAGEGDRGNRGGGAPLPIQVVAEQNQGGKMVESVLRTADPNLRVKMVTATVSKSERAAPVAMLFEAGKVVLHGRLPELEAELLGMIAGGDYEGPGTSPDRVDAMVWGLTELMLGKQRALLRISIL